MTTRTPAARPAAWEHIRSAEHVENFISAIAMGSGVESAAEYAGIPARTVKRWLQKGRDAEAASEDNAAPILPDDWPYVDFTRKVQKARADAVVRNVTLIAGAAQRQPIVGRNGVERDANGDPVYGPGDWKAAAWLLERTHPQEFGPTQRTELTGAGGGPIHTQTDVDVQVGFAVSSDAARTAAIANAMLDAGIIALPASAVHDDADG
jgi:hypothetical protein